MNGYGKMTVNSEEKKMNGGKNTQVVSIDEVVKVWKSFSITKEELERAVSNDEFYRYMQYVIDKEFERRMNEYVQECHQVQEHIREND